MELSELAQIRLMTIGGILIFFAIWTRGIVVGRRRQATSRISRGRSVAR